MKSLPEYCLFRLQPKQFYVIFRTFSPSFPAPARTSQLRRHHISTLLFHGINAAPFVCFFVSSPARNICIYLWSKNFAMYFLQWLSIWFGKTNISSIQRTCRRYCGRMRVGTTDSRNVKLNFLMINMNGANRIK